MAAEKIELLKRWFCEVGDCLIAYSGGTDSVLLAVVAHLAVGSRSLAVIADSPSLPRHELDEALALSKRHGFNVKIVQTREFENPSYIANPSNRCYFCKAELFSEMAPLARELGLATIVYGENATDLSDDRPGALAAKEFHVRAPLKELGFSKSDVRACSALLGLSTANKAQMACLSSRIPHGEVVSEQKLRMIEAAESILRSLGFHDLRVRHHELSSGALARIEVGQAEVQSALDPRLRGVISVSLSQIGYRFVTLDLVGYKSHETVTSEASRAF